MVSLKSLFLAILATGAAATASVAEAADPCKLGKQVPVNSLPKPFRILVQSRNFTGPILPFDKDARLTTDPKKAVHVTLKNNYIYNGKQILGVVDKPVHAPIIFSTRKTSDLSLEAVKVCDTATKKPVMILRNKIPNHPRPYDYESFSYVKIEDHAALLAVVDEKEDTYPRANLIIDA